MNSQTANTLAQILMSPQAPWLVLIAFGLIAYITYVIQKGWVSIHSDKITIGKRAAETEQVILRRQVEYIDNAVNATMRHIPRHDKFDEWRTRFVLEKVIDTMVNWCMFNHIDTSERYIRLKAEEVWTVVQKYTWHEVYQTEEFHDYVLKFVREVIENLVAYRREYGKQK